ncbi:MAG: hypothetical protein Q7S16_04075 [bacterium]|nr:hypothetical protein [bacterium]
MQWLIRRFVEPLVGWLRAFARWILEGVPRDIWAIETLLWWGNAIVGSCLWVFYHLVFYNVQLFGKERQVEMGFTLLYIVLLLFFGFLKEVRRHTMDTFESSRLGHIFIIGWGITGIEIGVVSHLSDAHDFPDNFFLTIVGVMGTAVFTKASQYIDEARMRKGKKPKKPSNRHKKAGEE